MWSSLVVWAALPLLAASNYKSRDEEELLNWCIKSDNHKGKPGPESSLYKQASWLRKWGRVKEYFFFLNGKGSSLRAKARNYGVIRHKI